MLLVEAVVALVAAAILPDIAAVAVHDAVLEGALEEAAIGPLEAANAAHLVVRPVASVLGPVGPEIHALALLHTVLEIPVVIRSVAPHLDPLPVLLVLLGDFGLGLDGVEVVLNVEAHVLAEDAEARCAVLLPEALVDLVAVWRAEDAQAARLSVDPVALERASVRPDQLPVPALAVFVVDDRVVSLLGAVLAVVALAARRLALLVDGQEARLPHVLERAELHRLKLQLRVLQA